MDPLGMSLMIVFVGISFCFIYMFFRMYRRALIEQKKNLADLDRQSNLPPMLDEHRATLVKKSCGTKMVGFKSSLECQREFVLVFEDEYEREIPLSVDEEIYLAIEEGDSGILALSDGKLYSFTLDE